LETVSWRQTRWRPGFICYHWPS